MSIVEAHAQLEADHAVVFVRTDDGEIHALEFGQHHESEGKHNHHDKLHAHIDKHSQGKSHGHKEEEEHATHVSKHEAFKVHVWSPIGTRPGGAGDLPSTWKPVKVKTYTPDTLSHELKHEWHRAVGSVFQDAKSFAHHVLVDKLGC